MKMGPQGKMGSTTRYTAIPGADVDQQQASSMGAKERLLSSNGSGSVSGSPGRIQDNVSRDSGIGGLKVKIHPQKMCPNKSINGTASSIQWLRYNKEFFPAQFVTEICSIILT